MHAMNLVSCGKITIFTWRLRRAAPSVNRLSGQRTSKLSSGPSIGVLENSLQLMGVGRYISLLFIYRNK
jgi:hypothetical protein